MGEMVGELNYNRILVPLDGSDESKSVLPYIRDLSPRFGSEVHILGVCIGSKRRRINELLEEYINDLSNELIQDSVKAKPVIIYGRPAEKILAYTKENDIDLVLMSTHGRSGVARWWKKV